MTHLAPTLDLNLPILIVDDLPAMRRITRNCLSQLGFTNIVEAEDSAQALEVLRSAPIGFVISDWQLPDVEPAMLLQHFREAAEKEALPILMVAPVNQREQALHSIPNPHTELVVKPFTAEVLRHKIAQALKPDSGNSYDR